MQLAFDRIVARLGATPPSEFFEACGIVPSGDRSGGYPAICGAGQSLEVPGVFIIGAASGNPLIKECLDQGYRAVEAILGNEVPSADDRPIEAMLEAVGGKMSAAELVQTICRGSPLFGLIPSTRMFALLRRGRLRRLNAGDTVFTRGEYTHNLHAIIEGEVGLHLDSGEVLRIVCGGFFGEIEALYGGRRRAAAIAKTGCLLLELDRAIIPSLFQCAPNARTALKRAAMMTQLQTSFGSPFPEPLLTELSAKVETVAFRPEEVLIEQDAEQDAVFVIQKGGVLLSCGSASEVSSIEYLGPGAWIGGAHALLGTAAPVRVKAAVATETLKLSGQIFGALLDNFPALRRRLTATIQPPQRRSGVFRADAAARRRAEFLVREGVLQAANVLLIDEALCIGCDNCETACAETHDGLSRLDRESGPALASLRMPTTCRHCDDAACLAACPVGAISQAPSGEVVIDEKHCIGCGDCDAACSYGSIRIEAAPPRSRVYSHGSFLA